MDKKTTKVISIFAVTLILIMIVFLSIAFNRQHKPTKAPLLNNTETMVSVSSVHTVEFDSITVIYKWEGKEMKREVKQTINGKIIW